jgi:hypothetical protein
MSYLNQRIKNAKIIFRIIIAFWTISLFSIATTAEAPVNTQATIRATTIKETIQLLDSPIVVVDLQYKSFYDINLSTDYLYEITEIINQLNDACDSGKYTEEAIAEMEQMKANIVSVKEAIAADIALYERWESEHYYAAKVWEYLKQRGYTDAVASGIIGNMMIETSGGSLDLKPTVYNPSGKYYGLCQWNKGYGLHGASFEKQLEYLDSSLEETFRAHGYRYKPGFTYEDFMSMTDPAKAALAFTKVYERCYSCSYGIRQQAAQKAYNYFTN